MTISKELLEEIFGEEIRAEGERLGFLPRRDLVFSCDNHVSGPVYGAPYADTDRTCEACGIKATRVYWRAREEEP